jgi:hypothetical protein
MYLRKVSAWSRSVLGDAPIGPMTKHVFFGMGGLHFATQRTWARFASATWWPLSLY